MDPVTVQRGVEGLMYLITECSKLMVCKYSRTPLGQIEVF